MSYLHLKLFLLERIIHTILRLKVMSNDEKRK